MTSLNSGPYADGMPVDRIDSLVTVVELVRTGGATTRPELVRVSGLGRTVVNQRVDQAIALNLLGDGQLGPSTGGRAPRQLRFAQERGIFLIGVFGALGVGIGVADLGGTLLEAKHRPWDITSGPDESLAMLANELAEVQKAYDGQELWGLVVGIPGPVEFQTGRPVAPPIMPGWSEYDIRGKLRETFDVPIWVDNDVNLSAIGALSRLDDPATANLLYVKVGTGIGAGLISHGRVHRGENGAAGDVGHIIVTDNPSVICRCGKTGCLEAVAGGWALARDGAAEAAAGRSPFLQERLTEKGFLRPLDVVDGARSGDPASVQLVAGAGRVVGENIASMINFFNPRVVTIGGAIAGAGDIFLAAVRQTVYQRSLPLATRDLVLTPAADPDGALRGGALLAVEELFDHDFLSEWINDGSPMRHALATQHS
jgi:predicted NBD/HSP70 family sugar kinase